jgi:hypothetical protein
MLRYDALLAPRGHRQVIGGKARFWSVARIAAFSFSFLAVSSSEEKMSLSLSTAGQQDSRKSNKVLDQWGLEAVCSPW